MMAHYTANAAALASKICPKAPITLCSDPGAKLICAGSQPDSTSASADNPPSFPACAASPKEPLDTNLALTR
jgi:hypothetical protein